MGCSRKNYHKYQEQGNNKVGTASEWGLVFDIHLHYSILFCSSLECHPIVLLVYFEYMERQKGRIHILSIRKYAFL